MTDQVEARNKGAVPDWGKDYGLRELWSEIKPGLFVGGTADDDTVAVARESRWTMNGEVPVDDAEITPEDFQAVVTMYAWARPVDWLVEEYRFGIYDSSSISFEADDFLDIVTWAHKRWKAGKKTLIRCQAGLSRSSFIASLVLVRDGMEPQEAVDLIRSRRSGYCLNINGSSEGGLFQTLLYKTPVEFWRS